MHLAGAADVRCVLFDLDDTLFDHAHATRQALARLHAEEPAFAVWTHAELVERHSVTLETMHVEVLAGRLTINEARERRFGQLLSAATNGAPREGRAMELATIYRSAYESSWRPVGGAIELLNAVRAQGLGVAIVTNNLVAEQREKLARCGMSGLVDVLVTSEEAGCSKPDIRIFQRALDHFDARADQAVMVGDAWSTDIEGALAAEIRAVWFNWRGTVIEPATARRQTVVEIRALEPTAQTIGLILGSSRVRG